MPREQINFPVAKPFMIDPQGNEHELTPDIPSGYTVLTDPVLNVTWQNGASDIGGHVQVSLDMDVNFLKHKVESLDKDIEHSAIFSPALSRADINRLIRVLRIARDKAYGRDE